MSERELTKENVREALGLAPKGSVSATHTSGADSDQADLSQAAKGDEPPAAEDTQPEPVNQPPTDYPREPRQLQEDNPNAAVLAVLYGSAEQRQAEHDWLARLHQPRPEDVA